MARKGAELRMARKAPISLDCADQSGAGVAQWAGCPAACVGRCWICRGAAAWKVARFIVILQIRPLSWLKETKERFCPLLVGSGRLAMQFSQERFWGSLRNEIMLSWHVCIIPIRATVWGPHVSLA